LVSNYQDVLDQLRAGGLIVESLEVGRLIRCKVEGERERRGWYILHEITTGTGDRLFVGSYGVWRGNDQGAIKIELRGGKSQLNEDQREALRQRAREDRRVAEQARAVEAQRAAQRASATWAKCLPTGECDYLARKGVGAHGVRFSPSGALVIPMLDAVGVIHGLQVVRSRKNAKAERRPEKEFWPQGLAKKGHFHLIGGTPTWIVLIAEGYATAASLHEATGHPVAIAFDAGNLAPVAQALHARYRTARILICADDDIFATHKGKDGCGGRIVLPEHDTDCPHCGKPHQRINTGVNDASIATLIVNGAFIVPRFADEPARRAKFLERGIKLSDFNDVHATEGLHVVRAQVEARLSELKWSAKTAPITSTTSGEGRPTFEPIKTLDELLTRFALVYGQSGTVFDRAEHQLVALSDMRDACLTRYLHRAWAEHPARAIVRMDEVGFDPGGRDANVSCNLWGGWPTKPSKEGKCDKLLELLRYMCSQDEHSEQLYNWVLRWLAYPIKVPGAKMKTTLVVHGPQGTGKNLLFEVVMAIYGRYGRMIDQSAIEDRFNDWASRKLFLIADEVVARAELFHIKNKLKALITGDWIRINPKNMAAYDERNHVNLVFLSNESLPVVLDEDDRRYTVIYTPPPKPQDFYDSVNEELRAVGIAAFHQYLLELDLDGFGEHTKPPLNSAKLELIEQSRDNISRFFFDLEDGDIPGFTAMPALAKHVYEAYRAWCTSTGHRAAPMPKLISTFKRKHMVKATRERWKDEYQNTKGPHGFLMLGGLAKAECPPGKDRLTWLGECAMAFGKQLDDAQKRVAA